MLTSGPTIVNAVRVLIRSGFCPFEGKPRRRGVLVARHLETRQWVLARPVGDKVMIFGHGVSSLAKAVSGPKRLTLGAATEVLSLQRSLWEDTPARGVYSVLNKSGQWYVVVCEGPAWRVVVGPYPEWMCVAFSELMNAGYSLKDAMNLVSDGAMQLPLLAA